MSKSFTSYPIVVIFVAFFSLTSCKNRAKPPVHDVAETPEQLEKKVKENIRKLLDFADDEQGHIGDSLFLFNTPLLRQIYNSKDHGLIWSNKEVWTSGADSMFSFLHNCKLYGLYPEDYYLPQLDSLNQRFLLDTSKTTDRRDAALWSKADVILTSDFLKLINDIKIGRIPRDSVSAKKDSVLTDSFYLSKWEDLNKTGSVATIMHSLEPKQLGYINLKEGLKSFLNSADNRSYTFVPPMGKDSASRSNYKRALQTRLYEGGYIDYDSIPADSVSLAAAVKKFQKKQGITVDGVAGEGTLRMMNLSDREKFLRIAITMDKYKQMPDSMPESYVLVNLPSYYMRLVDNDTVKIHSKIVCGKPNTRTPLLTSAISEMITYPLWTIPNSIIVKEILPAAKRDPGYFAKKGFSLIDKDGNVVDPYTVEWSKYSKGIPYKVVQGSGDDNALGILKFNFNNKYSVYLHDTNQRYLFARDVRSLSHGCVRVQDWEKLAYSILRHDNPDEKKLQVKEDSLKVWLDRKEKHSIPIRNRLPLFIRYFTCEGKDGEIVFYDDMYGEDKYIEQQYFARK